jgi:hypothetical protein
VAYALLWLNALFSADESLINLDNRARAAHGRKIASPESFADTMAEKPRGFVGDS